MTDEDRAEIPVTFATLVSLVDWYADKDDKEVQAFLTKAKRLAKELLIEKSSENGRESGGDCSRAA